MGFMTPEAPAAATPMPKAPPPPEARPPAQTPNARPQRKSMQPTFLGTGATPQAPANVGGKSLLGQ